MVQGLGLSTSELMMARASAIKYAGHREKQAELSSSSDESDCQWGGILGKRVKECQQQTQMHTQLLSQDM